MFFGGFLKWIPKAIAFNTRLDETDLIWDDLGYPHFRKPPNGGFIIRNKGYSRKSMTVHDVQARISKKIIDVRAVKHDKMDLPHHNYMILYGI